MKKIAFFTAVISLIVVMAGCGTPKSQQSPLPPPVVPVTPGYIQSHDNTLGFGFDYPENWAMEVTPYMPGQDPSLEKLEVYTKKDEPTKFEVSVKSTSFKSLAEIQAFGFIDRQSILKESFIEVNNRQAYEVIFRQYPNDEAMWIIFLANGKEYAIRFYTTEALYPANEETFNHIIASFVID
jgi:hypothetical protein